MIDKNKIEKLLNEFIPGTGIFLAGIKISASNKILILADTVKGITIDECAMIHRHIENNLDRETEDFELQVSSPGLDSPFQVHEQFMKNEGKKVEVIDIGGNIITGLLKNVTRGGFEVETEIKIKGKGKEKKDVSFNSDEVKTIRLMLSI
jgi:ribosome maturation factor RimP